MTTSRQLRAISLFTGVGGMDHGFDAAGFTTAVAVEMDRVACRTLRLNRGWPVLEGDIHTLTSETILRTAGMEAGEPDLLFGGPPCQPFSKSGYWAQGDSRRLEDPRASTLGQYMRVLGDTRPRAFVLENVHGLAFKGKDEGLQLILDGVDAINRQHETNYRVTWAKLNAADYGVPQLRERVVVVGTRDGTPFRFPSATHSATVSSEREHWRTAWDALGDLPNHPDEPGLAMGGRWADLLPSVPEGENYLWHTPRGGGRPLFGWRTRYWSFLLKLAKNRPAWTIQAQPGSAIGPFHWTNRRLSTHELCRLQTFPENIVFDCGRTNTQKMIGNAVPSLLAEVLGREIRKQVFGRAMRSRLKLLPAIRSPVPEPEPLQPVPPKYAALVAEHAAHPGEGLGNRAILRRAA